jgi:O-antigen ligase
MMLIVAIYFFYAEIKARIFLEYGVVERLALWAAAFKAFLQHPLTGLGPGAFIAEKFHFLFGNVYIGAKLPAHNTYLEIMAERGLLGIITFLIFCVIFLKRSFRIQKRLTNPYLKNLQLGINLGIIAFLINNFTNSSFFICGFDILIGILIGFSIVIPSWNIVNQ